MDIVPVKADIIKGFITVVIKQMLAPLCVKITDSGLVYRNPNMPDNVGILLTADLKKALKFVELEEFSDSFKPGSRMNVDNIYLFDKIHSSIRFNKYLFSNTSAIALKRSESFSDKASAELFVKFINYTNIKYKAGTAHYTYTYPREPLLQLKTAEYAFGLRNLYERYTAILSTVKKGILLKVPSVLTIDFIRELVPEMKDLHDNTLKAFIGKFTAFANRDSVSFDILTEYDNVSDLKFDLLYYYKNKFMLVS